MNMLRDKAPGWLPVLVPNKDGGMLHRAPVGAYLLIQFRHADGAETPPVPQAIMDTRNNSVALENITARDITDTHRRGVCMAAAFTFGLAYELWAKMPLETGYAEEAKPEPQIGRPLDGVWEAMNEEQQAFLLKIADEVAAYFGEIPDAAGALDFIIGQQLDSEETAALWTKLDSKQRSALKRAKTEKDKQA
jgi:hypothetical protein